MYVLLRTYVLIIVLCVSVCSCVLITLCIKLDDVRVCYKGFCDEEHASECGIWLQSELNSVHTYVWYAYPAKQTEKRCTKCVWCWGTMTDTWTSCLLVDSLECGVLCTLQASILHSAFQYLKFLTIPLFPSSSSQRPTLVWPSAPFPLHLTSVSRRLQTH